MKNKKPTNKDFPGYPHYPKSEDITQQGKRVAADLDNPYSPPSADSVPRGKDTAGEKDPSLNVDDDLAGGPENEFDVTSEDLEALGPKDLSLDLGEDEELKHRTTPVDFSGDDLDVPGSEADDAAEATGSEDEENNSYSLGGDRHEDLEEDRS